MLVLRYKDKNINMEKMTERQIEEIIQEVDIEDNSLSCKYLPPDEFNFCEKDEEGTTEKYWDNISGDCSSD